MGRRVAAGLLLTGCGDSGSPAFLERYSITGDPSVITVFYTTGPCDTAGNAAVAESADAVRVTVLVQVAPADAKCDSIGPVTRTAQVRLAKPLGARAVKGREQDPELPRVPAPS